MGIFSTPMLSYPQMLALVTHCRQACDRIYGTVTLTYKDKVDSPQHHYVWLPRTGDVFKPIPRRQVGAFTNAEQLKEILERWHKVYNEFFPAGFNKLDTLSVKLDDFAQRPKRFLLTKTGRSILDVKMVDEHKGYGQYATPAYLLEITIEGEGPTERFQEIFEEKRAPAPRPELQPAYARS